MKANPTPLPRPPNPEILKHEMLRKVEGKLFVLKKELTAEGKMTEDEISEFITKERKRLQEEADKMADPMAKQ